MHTPGPWDWQESAGGHHGLIYSTVDETGKTLALTYGLKDARLIAAAPQLLEACREMCKLRTGNESIAQHKAYKLAKAAIAAAE